MHTSGHGETVDLLVALGLLRLSRWVLCGCIWMMPGPWSSGGAAGVLVGYEIDFLRKCKYVLGRAQQDGRVAAD
jgi:hypothetical protein